MSVIEASDMSMFFKSIEAEMRKQTELLTEIRDAIFVRREIEIEEEKPNRHNWIRGNLDLPRGRGGCYYIYGLLERSGIKTINQLLSNTEEDLVKKHLLSVKSIERIKQALEKKGLHLKPNQD